MPLISFTPGSATVTLFCNQVLCKATPANMSEERDHRTRPGSCPDSPASSRPTEGRSLHSAGLLGSFSLQFHDSRVMVFIPCSLASMCHSSAWRDNGTWWDKPWPGLRMCRTTLGPLLSSFWPQFLQSSNEESPHFSFSSKFSHHQREAYPEGFPTAPNYFLLNLWHILHTAHYTAMSDLI